MAAPQDIVPLDSSERCPLTELIKTQCAHCRPPAAPVFAHALFDSPGDTGPGPIFAAQYAGRCGRCDGFFEEHDWICRTGTGDYICEECGNA